MTRYSCSTCGYSTDKTSSWKGHQERKVPCILHSVAKFNVDAENSAETLPAVAKILPAVAKILPDVAKNLADVTNLKSGEGQFKCASCYKEFRYHCHLIRHKECGCSKKPAPNGCPDCKHIFQTRHQLYYHRKQGCSGQAEQEKTALIMASFPDHIRQHIEKMIHEVVVSQGAVAPAVAPIQENHGIVYNGSNVIQNNIQIVHFGREEDDHVRDLYINRFQEHPHRIERRIDNNPAHILAETVHNLHFHPKHPENWNIHQAKPSEKFIQVFNSPKERWDDMVREEVYNTLLDSTSQLIEEVVETIGANPKMSFQDILQKKNVRKTVMKKLEEAVLNGCKDIYDRIKSHPKLVPEAWRRLIASKTQRSQGPPATE